MIRINIHFVSRTIDNNMTNFKLPTAYNAPGQKNITDEDDKEKIHIDNKTGNVEEYTLEQLQDVVNGWMRYIRKFVKSNKDMVCNCIDRLDMSISLVYLFRI